MAAKRRRRKGDGSVYQNPDGSYTVAVRIGGRLIRRRAADAKAAEAIRQELIRQRDAGISVGDGGQRLDTWLNAWYAIKTRHLKPRSLSVYRYNLEAYILPALGSVALNKLRADNIQAFLDGVQDDIQTASGGRYSGANTVHALASLLSEALDLAVQRRLIPFNPMAGVVLPKYKPAKVTPPTETQIQAFAEAARSHRLAPLWHLYALLGLRRGEGLGVRWQDYDPQARTLRIVQQAQAIDGAMMIGTPKSEAGARLLPIPDEVCAMLDERRAAQLRQRVKRADTWQDNDLVFCTRDGRPIWSRNLELNYYALRRAAGMPETMKLHHLRHGVSTMLDEAGASEALKADILGHEKETTTQHYTHARLAAMRRVLERVADVVIRKTGS